jgi:hypothetical protein
MKKYKEILEVTMSKQTAVDWLEEQYYESEGKLTRHDFEQAKIMYKKEMTNAIKTEIKLIGNYFDVGKLEQREQGHHIRFTSILKDRFDHYNKTYDTNTTTTN